jgi:hypothetical protein
MGKINLQRVLVGGLLAGIVLSILDVSLYGVVLKAPMAAAWQAFGKPTMTNHQRSLEVPTSVFLDFVSGIFLVWVYAAIRPRFGAGAWTAVKTGFVGWFMAALLCSAFMAQGVMSGRIMIITTLVLLVEYPLAVVIGAKFYTEGDAMSRQRGKLD